MFMLQWSGQVQDVQQLVVHTCSWSEEMYATAAAAD